MKQQRIRQESKVSHFYSQSITFIIPAGYSVKDGINGDGFALSYAWVDDAIDLIMQEGRGTLPAKNVIRDAYRLIPVDLNRVICFSGRLFCGTGTA